MLLHRAEMRMSVASRQSFSSVGYPHCIKVNGGNTCATFLTKLTRESSATRMNLGDGFSFASAKGWIYRDPQGSECAAKGFGVAWHEFQILYLKQCIGFA